MRLVVNPYDDLAEMLLLFLASISILGLCKLKYDIIYGGLDALLVNVAHKLFVLGSTPAKQPADNARM